MEKLKIAIVGATGLVGATLLKIISQSSIEDCNFILVASPKSVGKKLLIKDVLHEVISVEDALLQKPDIAIFSAGSDASLKYAPAFAANGCFVIDNSSAWRMHDDVPLVVPEVNGKKITQDTKIIANPNCSTIQMVMVLAALHENYKIKRIVISTYQSVTGTGVKAVNQLTNERLGVYADMAYPDPIDLNVLPYAGKFNADGYSIEEIKLENETRKILNDYSINVSATVVRVPVFGGHSEAVNVEFQHEYSLQNVNALLFNTKGVVIMDNIDNNVFPTPRFCEGRDEVFVGRIRRDFSQKNSLNLWIVADNLRKGAATNALQIANIVRNFFPK